MMISLDKGCETMTTAYLCVVDGQWWLLDDLFDGLYQHIHWQHLDGTDQLH